MQTLFWNMKLTNLQLPIYTQSSNFCLKNCRQIYDKVWRIFLWDNLVEEFLFSKHRWNFSYCWWDCQLYENKYQFPFFLDLFLCWERYQINSKPFCKKWVHFHRFTRISQQIRRCFSIVFLLDSNTHDQLRQVFEHSLTDC